MNFKAQTISKTNTDVVWQREVEVAINSMIMPQEWQSIHKKKKRQQNFQNFISGLKSGAVWGTSVALAIAFMVVGGERALDDITDMVSGPAKANPDAVMYDLSQIKTNRGIINNLTETEAGAQIEELYAGHPEVMADYFGYLADRVEKTCGLGNVDKCNKKLQAKILGAFEHYGVSDSFEKLIVMGGVNFAFSAAADPEFAQARTEWKAYSRAQKLAILTDIAHREIEAFNPGVQMPKPDVVVEDLPDPGEVHEWTIAYYEEAKNEIVISDFALDRYIFDAAAENVGHEVGHVVVDAYKKIIQKSIDGTLPPIVAAVAPDIKLFDKAMGSLKIQYDTGHHDTNPEEKIADVFGAIAINAGKGALPIFEPIPNVPKISVENAAAQSKSVWRVKL